MLIIAAALIAASPLPALDAAMSNYAELRAQTERGGDAQLSATAAIGVCRLALAYVRGGRTEATDAIIAYRGPGRDRLLMACALYFQVRAR